MRIRNTKILAAGMVALLTIGNCMGFSDISYAKTGTKKAKNSLVKINKTTFPDKTFREYVLDKIDQNKDKKLGKNEIRKTKKINVNIYRDEESGSNGEYNGIVYKKIKNLKGIEFFTALENLDCGSNKLTELDLSGNVLLKELRCDSNQLENIELGQNTVLETLYCVDNKLTKLDLQSNVNLKNLFCDGNSLKSINLKKNNLLENVSLDGNALKKLELQENKKLSDISCVNNKLTEVSLPATSTLESINLSNNSIKTLDISKNKKLKVINLDNNLLESINLPVFKAADILNLSCNSLDSLEIEGKIGTITVSDNKLTDLDINECKKTTEINCSRNQLEELDIFDCTELSVLECAYNKLTELDISYNKKLLYLDCNNNSIEELITGKGPLFNLDARDNKIKELNLKGYKDIKCLAIKGNDIYVLTFANGIASTLKEFDDVEFGLYINSETEETDVPLESVVVKYKGAMYDINTDGTACLSQINNRLVKKFGVPDSIKYNGKRYKVTKIYPLVAENYKYLKTLTIGKNVEEIGGGAFENCKKLKKVTIKSALLKSVGTESFLGTSSTISFEVPKDKLTKYKKLLKKSGASKTAQYIEM